MVDVSLLFECRNCDSSAASSVANQRNGVLNGRSVFALYLTQVQSNMFNHDCTVFAPHCSTEEYWNNCNRFYLVSTRIGGDRGSMSIGVWECSPTFVSHDRARGLHTPP